MTPAEQAASYEQLACNVELLHQNVFRLRCENEALRQEVQDLKGLLREALQNEGIDYGNPKIVQLFGGAA